MGYHSFIDELSAAGAAGNAYGSFVLEFIAADPYLEAGWYWTACFPSAARRGFGCLNDSDPVGPFETMEDAMRDAQHA